MYLQVRLTSFVVMTDECKCCIAPGAVADGQKHYSLFDAVRIPLTDVEICGRS